MEQIRSDIEMAFRQEDLERVWRRGASAVYLVGGRFSIPLERRGVEYLLLANPVVEWQEPLPPAAAADKPAPAGSGFGSGSGSGSSCFGGLCGYGLELI